MFPYIPYITLLLVGAACIYITPKKQGPVFLTFALLVLLFMGTRHETGSDWEPYLRLYETTNEFSDYPELGFQFLILASKKAELSHGEFIFLCSLSAPLLLWSLKDKSTNLGIAALGFLAYLTPLFMGGIRQGIALGFISVAFIKFVDQPILAIFLILVASSFHYTALFTTPLIVLAVCCIKTQSTTLWLAALITCAILGFCALPDSLQSLMYALEFSYAGNESVGIGSPTRDGILYAEWITISILAIYSLRSALQIRTSLEPKGVAFQYYRLCCIFSIIGACIYLFLWEHSRMTAGRFTAYFRPSTCIMLACAPYYVLSAKWRNVALLVIATYLAIRFCFVVIFSAPYYMPYNSILSPMTTPTAVQEYDSKTK